MGHKSRSSSSDSRGGDSGVAVLPLLPVPPVANTSIPLYVPGSELCILFALNSLRVCHHDSLVLIT